MKNSYTSSKVLLRNGMGIFSSAARLASISWITFVCELEDMATHEVALWGLAFSISATYCRCELALTARVLLA